MNKKARKTIPPTGEKTWYDGYVVHHGTSIMPLTQSLPYDGVGNFNINGYAPVYVVDQSGSRKYGLICFCQEGQKVKEFLQPIADQLVLKEDRVELKIGGEISGFKLTPVTTPQRVVKATGLETNYESREEFMEALRKYQGE